MLKKLLAVAVLAACSTAHAADDGKKFRVGALVGRSTIEVDSVDAEFKSTGWSVFAGYQFNQYLAAELGYIDAGTGSDLGVDIDSSGELASVLGSYGLNDSWSIYGRVGLLHWKADLLGPGGTADADGNDAYYGAGVALFAEGAYLRLEYDMSQLDDADLSQLTLGVAWRF